jgi:lipopolysaccharide/colanic/teichoic acid biosynthesis glycosyltransferase
MVHSAKRGLLQPRLEEYSLDVSPGIQIVTKRQLKSFGLRLAARQSCLRESMVDVLLAIGLMTLTALLLMIVVGIKLYSPGPVQFRHRRRRVNTQEFAILGLQALLSSTRAQNCLQQVTTRGQRITRLARRRRLLDAT